MLQQVLANTCVRLNWSHCWGNDSLRSLIAALFMGSLSTLVGGNTNSLWAQHNPWGLFYLSLSSCSLSGLQYYAAHRCTMTLSQKLEGTIQWITRTLSAIPLQYFFIPILSILDFLIFRQCFFSISMTWERPSQETCHPPQRELMAIEKFRTGHTISQMPEYPAVSTCLHWLSLKLWSHIFHPDSLRL